MQVVGHLKQKGYPVMKKGKNDEWLCEGSSQSKDAHVFPYFKGNHAVMDKLPDAAIVVASNKGGRGLDLKLDGSCPPGARVGPIWTEVPFTNIVLWFLPL